jgi:hypothetical protein
LLLSVNEKKSPKSQGFFASAARAGAAAKPGRDTATMMFAFEALTRRSVIFSFCGGTRPPNGSHLFWKE